MLLLPPRRSEPDHVQLVQPFAFCAGGIQTVPTYILAAFGQDVLRWFQQKAHHRKGPNLSFEEVVVGAVGDHRGLAVQIGSRQSAR